MGVGWGWGGVEYNKYPPSCPVQCVTSFVGVGCRRETLDIQNRQFSILVSEIIASFDILFFFLGGSYLLFGKPFSLTK